MYKSFKQVEIIIRRKDKDFFGIVFQFHLSLKKHSFIDYLLLYRLNYHGMSLNNIFRNEWEKDSLACLIKRLSLSPKFVSNDFLAYKWQVKLNISFQKLFHILIIILKATSNYKICFPLSALKFMSYWFRCSPFQIWTRTFTCYFDFKCFFTPIFYWNASSVNCKGLNWFILCILCKSRSSSHKVSH